MMRMALAAMAAFALCGCDQLSQLTGGGSGPPLPPVRQGAQAPMTQTRPTGQVQQANVTAEVRQQLIANIGQQLDSIGQQFAAGMAPPQGFTDQVQPMQPGTDHRFQIDLTAGTPYVFIGACDGDCTNVDIELIDVSTGGVVASDVLPDDYPVVQYQPQANGRYIVRLLMQTCTVAPCFAGARALMQSPNAGGGK
ncbi:MAG: hypothetical protein JNJ63_05935 [Hyphomonadaceae bacterium]|nr:hypothetical protein [Hyphomonadaceae bacterium]